MKCTWGIGSLGKKQIILGIKKLIMTLGSLKSLRAVLWLKKWQPYNLFKNPHLKIKTTTRSDTTSLIILLTINSK